MAKSRKGGSLSGLSNQAKRLRAEVSKIKKAKRDKQRAAKLRRKVETLRRRVKQLRKNR